MENSVTTLEAAKCRRLLETAFEWLTAAQIAAYLQLAGKRETQRRHVRAIIRQLRDNGSKIVASLQGGYWLTKDDDSLWKDYNEHRQIHAKRIIGEAARRKKQIASPGQEFLFDTRQPVGCAVGGGTW